MIGVGRSVEFRRRAAMDTMVRIKPLRPLMSRARLLRGHAMQMRNTPLPPTRRFAAGIDIGPREVRLVIASRARRARWPVGVEWIGAAPLAAGALRGGQVVDQAAVAAALSSLCARWPRRRAMRGMPCTMAAPDRGAASAAAVGATHPEARVEAAAAAGIAIAAVDSEPLAALRALAHAGERGLRPSARFAAIWAGYDGVHGWRIAERTVRASIRFPGGEDADMESALRTLVGRAGVDRALVGGDFALFERVGVTLADLGECLGCTVAPFECASFGTLGRGPGKQIDWKRGAAFAVAFGLALRGVSE
jgi:Tfp pilus assembly PilM family ATPase